MSIKRVGQRRNKSSDFVANSSVMLQRLCRVDFLRGKLRWIVESNVNHFGVAGKDRTCLMSVATDRDDVIEPHILQIRYWPDLRETSDESDSPT